MKEEQIKEIKEIKEDLLKFPTKFGKHNKAAFLIGARKLNLTFHKAGAIAYEDYILLDNMLETEIEVMLIVQNSERNGRL